MNELTAQQGAGASVLVPSSNFMTAAATLNWIAFQQATDADLTGRDALWREFGFEPVLPPDVGGWDYVVAEAAGLLEPEHQALMQRWQNALGREPRDLQAARDIAIRYRETRGWSAVELHLYSTGKREICAQRLGKQIQAQHDLIDALAAERLTTWATKIAGFDPNREAQLIGAASAVPWQFFLTPGATVEPFGKITSASDVGYLGARFRTVEVLTVWPLSDTPARSTAPVATAEIWMASNVTHYVANQRDARVKECRLALGITQERARAGWDALPVTIKGPPRTPGR